MVEAYWYNCLSLTIGDLFPPLTRQTPPMPICHPPPMHRDFLFCPFYHLKPLDPLLSFLAPFPHSPAPRPRPRLVRSSAAVPATAASSLSTAPSPRRSPRAQRGCGASLRAWARNRGRRSGGRGWCRSRLFLGGLRSGAGGVGRGGEKAKGEREGVGGGGELGIGGAGGGWRILEME
jgi:hypothetical protein